MHTEAYLIATIHMTASIEIHNHEQLTQLHLLKDTIISEHKVDV